MVTFEKGRVRLVPNTRPRMPRHRKNAPVANGDKWQTGRHEANCHCNYIDGPHVFMGSMSTPCDEYVNA